MAQEIERKWLCESLPDKSYLINPEAIQQGYLNGNPIQPRLRESILDGIITYYLTMKGKSASDREELETKIDELLFETMWMYTNGIRLNKIRYHSPIANTAYIAEIDKYKGELLGLFTIEVEFSSIEEKDTFVAPAWFGAVREVTIDPRFKNVNLARNGWNPEWLKE